ncbi:MAG TPA: CUAEP/CCAEP-tail radical SAM protein [Acidimicrobiales bacterium]|nr:CUAEP/CCAEP-tail radical SAM protein [Acidimicrobiales bacterium]
MRILLLSTYELGHQPLGLASAAAALTAAGHVVCPVDLSLDMLTDEQIDWAEAAAVSVPMHTATRLAAAVVSGMKGRRPDLRVCAYGLYAAAAAQEGQGRFDLAIGGEYEPRLTEWANGLEAPTGGGEDLSFRGLPGPVPVALDLGRHRPGVPDRRQLPGLDRYARLVHNGQERLVGYVEASRGCVHRCRHCPVPVVYDGRLRTVAVETVVGDIDRLVEAGATHITFGDPDFLNGPQHSLRVVREMHRRHLGLTFDATVKVEHILRHRRVWPELAEAGLLFVVSAFETVNDSILLRLDKNHTAAQEAEAVTVLRRHGVEIRPSFLPFSPWTELEDMTALVNFVTANGLESNVDPVQYSIRLLVPPGSLLLGEESPDVFGPYDPVALGHPWQASHPGLDELQSQLSALAEAAPLEDPAGAFVQVHALVSDAARRWGVAAPGPLSGAAGRSVPRLTESWFCCAEPTCAQLERAGAAGASGWRGGAGS